jgi:hypothetical protein
MPSGAGEASLRVLQLLQDENPGTLADHDAIALGIEGTWGELVPVVEARSRSSE